MGIAWLLSFDADDELAAYGRSYAPSAAMLARFEALVPRVVGLVREGDVIVREGARADGLPGRAWCPTRSAIERLARAGATPPRAPSVDVLRRANHRRLCADLGQTLPRAAYVTSMDALRGALEQRHAEDETWLLKRPFGFAGRGRRRVSAGRLDAADLGFVQASFRAWGGLQVEPLVRRVADFGLHGFLGEDGSLTLGSPTVQVCDQHGAWLETRLAGPSELPERALLEASARDAASALAALGYFGPFGVDAFRWESESGELAFNARSEVNARYSMGWAVGMGPCRPDV